MSAMRTGAALLLLAIATPALSAPPHGNPVRGSPIRGKALYAACMGCHAIDDNDVGPRHRGVVGRKAGTQPGYAYSPALARSGLTWTPAQLDRWLQGPQKLVPGAKMFFSIANPTQRADIIAYLATQK